MIYRPVRTSRIAHRRRGRENLYPQDAELNWAVLHSYSAGVAKRVARAPPVVPFEQAADQVSAAGAIRIGKRQAEELAIGAVADSEAFYAPRHPDPCWPDDPADLRKSKKRTAELAGVADITPAPRTAHDVLTALFGPPRGADAAGRGDTGSRHGPKAQSKTLFASARKPIPAVICDAFTEARRGDPGHVRPRFALADGNNAQIDAINALAADACADYLEHKQDYLDYPAFLAAGRPVATGLIEGAACWLIKDRMEVTGARWSLDGAEAVLKLRALVGNGDFDDYFAFHLKQEKQRNHDSRYQQPQAA